MQRRSNFHQKLISSSHMFNIRPCMGKTKSTKSCLGDGLHRSDLAKRSPILSDCNPLWQLCDLCLKDTKSTPWYVKSHEKNSDTFFPLNPGWFIGILIPVTAYRSSYVGRMASPMYPKQPDFFSLLNWKENSSKSCSSIPLSKNIHPILLPWISDGLKYGFGQESWNNVWTVDWNSKSSSLNCWIRFAPIHPNPAPRSPCK